MAINSRAKGCRGEIEVAKLFRSYGFPEARRGQQYHGGPDSPDVVGVPGLHIEVKRTERLNLYDALAQAKRDAGEDLPVVIHRKNDSPWVAIMDFDDWMKIFREWFNA